MKRFRFERFLCFFLSLLLLPMHFVFATELSSVYALPTTHLTSASANYKFYLTLNGSASWAAGETMTITFPSGYALTSFTEDDVDVAVASVDFTTAATCAGSEQMAIGVSGAAVTFEMCAGDGGSVSSGSVVEIELGLNASSSGSSTHQVTNPSGAGSYFIAISGTFGADGSVIVPIAASSGSGVSVTVPDADPVDPGGGDGGCGSCGGGDSTPDPDPDPTPDPDPDTDPDTDPTSDPDPDTDPDTDPDADPDSSPDPDPTSDPDTDPTSDPDPDTDPTSDPDPDTDSDTDPDSNPDSDPAPDSDTDPTSDPDSDTDPGNSDGSWAGSNNNGEDLAYRIEVSAEDISLSIIDHTVSVLADTFANLAITFTDGDPFSVSIEHDGERVLLTEFEDGVWRSDVPVGFADSFGTIIVADRSGEVVASSITFDVIAPGVVYEVLDGQSVGVEGATVTVLNSDGSVWNADAYGQVVSIITNGSGSGFAWYVPSGTYVVRVEKGGYETSETTVAVTGNILAPTLFISRIDEDVLVVTEDAGIPEKVLAGVFQGLEAATILVNDALMTFKDNTPEEVAGIAVLAATATTVIAAAVVGGSQLWLLLYSFLSQPLLFFARKKYRKVGIVYHSVTKIPLDLVTVRAYNAQTNRLVKTVVTNEKGEFFLHISEEGTYRLRATKQGFVFPSAYLGDVKEDGVYLDVYAGQDIVLTQHAQPLAVSIPLDPVESFVPAKVLKWERTKRRIAFVLSPLSVFVSFGVFVVYTSIFAGILLSVQILLYALMWRIAHKKRKQTWGIVYDEITRRPVGNVVIRLFEPKYNKLVDSLLSDANGRYVFALGPNEYYVTFAKDGYLEATVKPIDFKDRKDISLFGINLPLRRHDGAAHE